MQGNFLFTWNGQQGVLIEKQSEFNR